MTETLNKREWTTPEVAMVSGADGDEVLAIWQQGSRQWATETGRYLNDWQVTARPLVVIDPEDREAVERLAIGYPAVVSERLGDKYFAWENRSESARSRIVDDLQAALREYAEPKPEEPEHLGAVVLDAKGNRWTRYRTGSTVPPWISESGRRGHWHQIDVDVVEILQL